MCETYHRHENVTFPEDEELNYCKKCLKSCEWWAELCWSCAEDAIHDSCTDEEGR